jgi:hypothetical protein
VVAATTAGCTGTIPGTGPQSLSTEVIQDDADRIAWGYPPVEGDGDGIGYVALERQREIHPGGSPAMLFQFNSTVAEFSTVESYNEYEADWFEARIRTPIDYQQEHGPTTMRVEPPGQWDGFRTYYDRTATHRELVLELRSIDTKGTIQVPFVLDPVTDQLPAALHCSFTVQASKPGWFGETIRASDSGRLVFDPDQ